MMVKSLFKILSAKSLQVVLSVLLLMIFSSPSWAQYSIPSGDIQKGNQTKLSAEFIPGQIIVKFKSGHGPQSLANTSFQINDVKKSAFGYTRLFISGDVISACSELKRNPSIEIAEPNYVRYLQVKPNDPLFFRQDNLKLSNAELGWNIETGDATVTVAVIDTGIDKVHPDLSANVLTGFNTRESDRDEKDDSGHGTAVSGVVGAVGNNNVGVTGSSWNVKILPIRACGGSSLTCNVVDEVEAIEQAIISGADIINLSLGGFGKSSMEEAACNNAWAAGIVLFAAAGNHGLLGKIGDPETESNINYPAGYANVCGVSSVDYPTGGDLNQITLSSFSNYGDAVSVTAVGSSVVTTAPSVDVEYLIFSEKADYGRIDGTSFSTPLVSGLAAVVKSHFPNLTASELRTRIETSVIDIGPAGWDDKFGWGLVDFQKALVGSTHSSNQAFNLGITTNPVLNDDIIVVVKVKLPMTGSPVISYSYNENGVLKSGLVPVKTLPSNSTIFTGRLNTKFSGSITFKVNGIASGGGNLPELIMEYFKGKSN